jgi:hypothetical protein
LPVSKDVNLEAEKVMALKAITSQATTDEDKQTEKT